MQKVAEFYKVSYEEFEKDIKDSVNLEVDGSYINTMIRNYYNDIQLPTRATTGSCGYDFKAPFGFSLRPGETMKIPTGIRVKIDDGWWLGCLPRSSYGFKYRVQLDNTMGVIDSDYFNAKNEGHIFIKITNNGQKRLEVDAGDGFVQGIFIPYGITYSDKVDGERTGGIGSTGK